MQFMFLILVFLLSYFIVPQSENNLFWRLPPLLKDFPSWINTLFDNLMFTMVHSRCVGSSLARL